MDNLVSTAADPRCFEVVVKIDAGDTAMERVVAGIQRDVAVNLKVVRSAPLPSYFHTYTAYNECLRESDPGYYFCWHVNDEILMETQHWDQKLERYIDFFPDGVFRLKVNPRKMLWNFFDIREACVYADYPIVPRRWLDGTQSWAERQGPDVYQEGVSIWLARYGHHRNIPLLDIKVGGDEPGENMTAETAVARARGTCKAWDAVMSSDSQENMSRCARRLELFIVAHKNGLQNYAIREDTNRKRLALVQGANEFARVSYAVDHVTLRLRNFAYIARRQWRCSLHGKSLPDRAALLAYRAAASVLDVAVELAKLPVGLLMGIAWTSLVEAFIHSRSPTIRWLVFRAGTVRRRRLTNKPRSSST